MSPLSSPSPSFAHETISEHLSDNDDVQLTPRSKVKALLAGLDDLEDEGVSVVSKTKVVPLQGHEKSNNITRQNAFVEDDSQDAEDNVIAPRGRLAARLQAQTKPESSTEDRLSVFQSAPDIAEQSSPENSRPKALGRFLKRKRQLAMDEHGTAALMNGSEDSDGSAPNQGIGDQVSPKDAANGESGDEAITKTNRFAALVEKKRAERIEREAVEEAKKAEKAAARKVSRSNQEVSEVDSEDEDDETGVRLTQRSRPARKAGKKAMEEMARETQRISRNMQLAHEAKTKKKITKDSLFARFRPKQQAPLTEVPASSSTANSSCPNSDNDIHKITPPTSPEHPSFSKPKNVPTLIPETSNLQGYSDDDLPSLADVFASTSDKGKGKAPELSFEDINPVMKPLDLVHNVESLAVELPELPPLKKYELKQRPIRLLPPKNPVKPAGYDLESDDELEVVQSKIFRVFDQLPFKKKSDEKSLLRLRALARLTSPSRRQEAKDRTSMTPQELAASLRNKARQQAAAERAEKIEVLRSKGVIIQTSEERQKDQMEVEDMLEKARKEVEELTKKEKEDAKKEKRANGEEVDDSSDDEDYQDKEDEVDEDVELSGSDEEVDEDDEDGSDKADDNNLVDEMAVESSANEEDESEPEGIDEETEMPGRPHRRRNVRRVLDDDDEEENEEEPKATKPIVMTQEQSPVVVQNPFGPQIGIDNAPMGLTQAFAATMADSQLAEGFSQEDSLLQLRSMPSPQFANIIPDSMGPETQQPIIEELDIDLHLTQTQVEHDTLAQNGAVASTQLSEMPDPTQDVGFEKSSPLPVRFTTAPNSTVDTVIVPRGSATASPDKKRKLVKKPKQRLASFSDEEEEDEESLPGEEGSDSEEDESESAFNVMQRAAKVAKIKEHRFDKGKSKAKEMFEEQAQESEDEYAGLGGASDDSEGEEDEEIRRMIDEGDVDLNERKVAAYFAEKEREENEAGISKLYKDINSGALRRKRGAGADFDDLDDSDDDHQARQARKRREFARMRKALLDGDSNIVKIAEDPKKMAFLRAIEDRDDQEDFGVLESTPRDQEDMDSQEVVPDSQSENRPPGALKRRADDSDIALPATKRITTIEARRTVLGAIRKPTTLADIRASVSFLVEEPDSMFSAKIGPSMFDPSSDVELEEEELPVEIDTIGAPDESQRKNPRRTGPRSINPQFVDRLSLKKQESSKESQSSGSHLAFMDPKFSSNSSGFKPPTLLRKATSSFSNFSAQDENGISTNNNAKKAAMEPDVKGRGVGGGSKRSSVNWYSREAERKAIREKRSGVSTSSSNSKGIKRQGSGLSKLLGSSSAWE